MSGLHSRMQMATCKGMQSDCTVLLLIYTTTIYKVKEEWCMIVCDTYKDSDKAFLDYG